MTNEDTIKDLQFSIQCAKTGLFNCMKQLSLSGGKIHDDISKVIDNYNDELKHIEYLKLQYINIERTKLIDKMLSDKIRNDDEEKS